MEKTENGTIWSKLLTIDYRYIYVIYLLTLCTFILVPVGFPILIDERTRIAYDWIENDLQPGDAVVFDVETWGRGSLMYEPLGLVFSTHTLQQGCRLIIVDSKAGATPYPIDALTIRIKDLQDTGQLPSGIEYGKDFVFIAPLGLGEIPKQALAKDIRGMGTDYYGTPLGDLEVMEGLYSIDDITALMMVGGGQHIEWIRQWSVPYGIPTLALPQQGNVPQFMPYYPSYLVSIVADLNGAAQYEQLTGLLGKGTTSMDAISAAVLMTFLFIVIGNVAYFANKRSEEGV